MSRNSKARRQTWPDNASENRLRDAEAAVQNELESEGVEGILSLGYGYVAEHIVERLARDGYLR